VQVPAQPLLAATSLGDQVVAVVDQQLQLAQALLADSGTGKPRLLERGPGYGERSDPVGLAAGRRRRHNAGRSDPRVDVRNRVSRRRPSLFKSSDAATAATMTLSAGMKA